ncbi:MAG: DNA/RNA nuclease SfsA [Bacteroidales bacterium]|nr:DNA/RNA nuclease SfsA [Bacteroidales bacterium]
MTFTNPLIPGKLIKRYKRFLADVELDSGETVTAHCTNSGSMKTCIEEGAEVYLSPASDPARKTKFTWEMIRIGGKWIGVNTSIPNLLAFEAVKNNQIMGLKGYSEVKREVTFGNSRIDIFAENENEKCFIEVKNVTMKVGNWARFPDAVTTRGKKHLETLMEIKAEGMRAVMLYVIQRMDVEMFGPAWEIDPDYAETLLKAFAAGVEVIPVMADVSPEKIEISKILPFDLGR